MLLAKAALLESYDWLMFVFTTWSASGHLPTAGAGMSLPACFAVLARAGVVDAVCKAADVEAIFQVPRARVGARAPLTRRGAGGVASQRSSVVQSPMMVVLTLSQSSFLFFIHGECTHLFRSCLLVLFHAARACPGGDL